MASGKNEWVPIPFDKSLKVTVSNLSGSNDYFITEYRQYANGTKVKPFSMADLYAAQETMNAVVGILTAPSNAKPATGLISVAQEQKTLTTGDTTYTKNITGSGAVRRLMVKLNAADMASALKNTVIKISFDGSQKV